MGSSIVLSCNNRSFVIELDYGYLYLLEVCFELSDICFLIWLRYCSMLALNDRPVLAMVNISVGVLTQGSGSQLVNAACFLVPDVDARGNTVMHGFILVPAAGPYVQQEGVRGHCIILHPECL